MARITVEDCIEVVQNRFELVLMASKRAREISSGAQICVPRDNDKNPVVALREISGNLLPINTMRQQMIRNFQNSVFVSASSDEIDEEIVDEMHTDGVWQTGEILREKADPELDLLDEDDI